MKRILAFLTALITLSVITLASTGPAGAAEPASDTGPNGEKAEAGFTLTPQKGDFYRGGSVAATWVVKATVTEPYEELSGGQDIFPLKEVNLKLPTDLTFNPDPKMPVCTDQMMNAKTNLSVIPSEAIKFCPKSVIGNGTAHLYLAHKNLPGGPGLKDAVLVVFNAGLEGGNPKVKIYGYSKGTTVGIFIQGVLEKDGTLRLKIPQLASDSAVGFMELNLPGATPIKYNYKSVPTSVGQDPNYLQARCSTGSWEMSSEFVLGTRDTNDQPTSPDYPVIAPDFSTSCVGKPGKPPAAGGKARIGKVVVKGPGTAKRGKKVTYKVKVKNTGKGVARKVKVVARGKGAKGVGRVGRIPAGKTKVVKVKVKFTRKGRSKVTFTASAKGAGKKSARKVVRVK